MATEEDKKYALRIAIDISTAFAGGATQPNVTPGAVLEETYRVMLKLLADRGKP